MCNVTQDRCQEHHIEEEDDRTGIEVRSILKGKKGKKQTREIDR